MPRGIGSPYHLLATAFPGYLKALSWQTRAPIELSSYVIYLKCLLKYINCLHFLYFTLLLHLHVVIYSREKYITSEEGQ